MDFVGHLTLGGAQNTWTVIFTYAIYIAIHLEIPTSLTIDNFWETFRIFIAKRGRSAIIYCDNGMNFTGTENLLKNVDCGVFRSKAEITRSLGHLMLHPHSSGGGEGEIV